MPCYAMVGTSTGLPHICPLESVFDLARVEKMWEPRATPTGPYLT